MKRRLMLGVSIAIGLGILIAILYYVGWRKILKQIYDLGGVGFSVLFVNIILTFGFWILTWQIILRSYNIRSSWKALIRATISGYAVSYLTPSLYLGGEPLRVYLIAKELGLPQPRLYATVILSKLLEGISLICFVFLGSFYALFVEQLPRVQKSSLLLGTIFISFWVGMGVINFAQKRLWASRAIRALMRLSPWKIPLTKVVEKVREVEEDIHMAFGRFQLPHTMAAFASCMTATLLQYLRPQIFFYFSQDVTFSFSKLSLLFALGVILASLFWITPGGIGVAEGGRIGIFALVGIGKAGAVAYSFALKSIELIFVMIGIICIMQFGLLRIRKER